MRDILLSSSSKVKRLDAEGNWIGCVASDSPGRNASDFFFYGACPALSSLEKSSVSRDYEYLVETVPAIAPVSPAWSLYLAPKNPCKVPAVSHITVGAFK